MIHTLRLSLALAIGLVAWGLVSMVAFAAVTTVGGTIQHVDAAAGRLLLRSAEGTLVAVQVPTALLASLQTGDRVEVKQAGPHALILRTLARVSRPPRAGALPRS